MANPLERRKNLLDDTSYQTEFNYEEHDVSINDKMQLIELEQKIKSNQMVFVKVNLEIGSLLYEAQKRLKNYGTGTFMKWYENLGFNKDNASYFLKRYELSSIFPNKREYIADMPVRLVKELTKKDIEIAVVEDAIKNEIKSTKELNAIKSSYSHSANNESVKTNKTIVEKEEIFLFLKNKLIDEVSVEKIEEIVESIFKNYKINRR